MAGILSAVGPDTPRWTPPSPHGTLRVMNRSPALATLVLASLSACTSRSDATTATPDPMPQAKLKSFKDRPVDVMAAIPGARQFADLAVKNDAFEIAAAKLALAKSASPAIKAYATKMIAAHTRAMAKIRAAAAAARPAITPDASSTKDYDTKLAGLRALSGAAFDQAYVAGQIHEHHAALSLYQLYAGGGDTPSLKAAATAMIAVLKQHLAMAESLNR